MNNFTKKLVQKEKTTDPGSDERRHVAAFAWAYVLERFLSGDLGEARNALTAARKQNPFAEALLTGAKPLPKSMPDSYGLGSVEEAAICADTLGLAWKRHPEAIQWLKAQPR